MGGRKNDARAQMLPTGLIFKTHLPSFASPISSFSETFGKRIVIDLQLCDLQRKKQIEKSVG